jgi:hypothetical protein
VPVQKSPSFLLVFFVCCVPVIFLAENGVEADSSEKKGERAPVSGHWFFCRGGGGYVGPGRPKTPNTELNIFTAASSMMNLQCHDHGDFMLFSRMTFSFLFII